MSRLCAMGGRRHAVGIPPGSDSAVPDCLTPRDFFHAKLRGMKSTLKSQPIDRVTDVPLPASFPRDPGDLSGGAAHPSVVSHDDDRYARGLRALAEITGESGESVAARLRDIAP